MFNDKNLHLFVDDYEIQHYTNLLRVINKPEKHKTPVLIADKEWECGRVQAWGSVIQEPDGLIRMWYFAMNNRSKGSEDKGGYCYAESRDGINWEKPDLGLVKFRGSTKNNIWYSMNPDSNNLSEQELAKNGMGLPAFDEEGNQIGVVNNLDGLTVVKDDDEPDPEKRYKLLANMQDHRMWTKAYRQYYPDVTEQEIENATAIFGQYIDTSPDGIHWTRRPKRFLPARYGDYMMVTKDHRNKQWWLNERPLALKGRNVGLRVSKDLISWNDPADILFSNTPEMGFGDAYQCHGGITPFNYGNMNLGMIEKWANAGIGDYCELVSGRDGLPWQRVVPGKPFLDTGPENSFDRVLAYPTHNAPIRIGNKLCIYYTGMGSFDPEFPVLEGKRMQTGDLYSPRAGDNGQMAMGVAIIGLDRFAGMAHVRQEAGRLLSKPVTITHSEIEINFEPVLNPYIKLGLRDTNGDFIPGFTHDDSVIDTYDHNLRTAVKWKNKTLKDIMGSTVFLDFEIAGSVLYSYRVFNS